MNRRYSYTRSRSHSCGDIPKFLLSEEKSFKEDQSLFSRHIGSFKRLFGRRKEGFEARVSPLSVGDEPKDEDESCSRSPPRAEGSSTSGPNELTVPSQGSLLRSASLNILSEAFSAIHNVCVVPASAGKSNENNLKAEKKESLPAAPTTAPINVASQLREASGVLLIPLTTQNQRLTPSKYRGVERNQFSSYLTPSSHKPYPAKNISYLYHSDKYKQRSRRPHNSGGRNSIEKSLSASHNHIQLDRLVKSSKLYSSGDNLIHLVPSNSSSAVTSPNKMSDLSSTNSPSKKSPKKRRNALSATLRRLRSGSVSPMRVRNTDSNGSSSNYSTPSKSSTNISWSDGSSNIPNGSVNPTTSLRSSSPPPSSSLPASGDLPLLTAKQDRCGCTQVALTPSLSRNKAFRDSKKDVTTFNNSSNYVKNSLDNTSIIGDTSLKDSINGSSSSGYSSSKVLEDTIVDIQETVNVFETPLQVHAIKEPRKLHLNLGPTKPGTIHPVHNKHKTKKSPRVVSSKLSPRRVVGSRNIHSPISPKKKRTPHLCSSPHSSLHSSPKRVSPNKVRVKEYSNIQSLVDSGNIKAKRSNRKVRLMRNKQANLDRQRNNDNTNNVSEESSTSVSTSRSDKISNNKSDSSLRRRLLDVDREDGRSSKSVTSSSSSTPSRFHISHSSGDLISSDSTRSQRKLRGKERPQSWFDDGSPNMSPAIASAIGSTLAMPPAGAKSSPSSLGGSPRSGSPSMLSPYCSSQESLTDEEEEETASAQQLPTTGILGALSSETSRSYLYGGFDSLLGPRELDRCFPTRTISIFIATWNMNSKEPPSFFDKFCLRSELQESPDMVVIGTQESGDDRKSWESKLQCCLGQSYVLLTSSVLGTLHLNVFVKRHLIWHCSVPEEDSHSLRPGTYFKTKGAIGLSFQFFGTKFLFINSHLFAHEEKNAQRIQNVRNISRSLDLPRSLKVKHFHKDVTRRFDCVFWLGDFNFRLAANRDYVLERLQRDVAQDPSIVPHLLQWDQLSMAKNKGEIFTEFQEGEITFAPTFKYDPGTDDYDTSSKQRVPSYTDRILFRSPRASITCAEYDSSPMFRTSDHKPVYGLYRCKIKPGRDDVALNAGHFNRDCYVDALKRKKKQMQKKEDEEVEGCALQ